MSNLRSRLTYPVHPSSTAKPGSVIAKRWHVLSAVKSLGVKPVREFIRVLQGVGKESVVGRPQQLINL
jgi:hypothetical protein